MSNYNPKLCDERHENIDKEFKFMWEKIKGLEAKFWSIILLLVVNLGGVITMLAKQ